MLLRRLSARCDRAAARAQLPGPDYYEVLGWIHSILRPTTYLEIGVARGESLRKAGLSTRCLAIDPKPSRGAATPPANVTLFRMTSDEYFRSHTFPGLHVDLAFLDGLHRFRQTLRDLEHLQPFLGKRSAVLIHDCLPLDARTASPVRKSMFWSGDVWKVVCYIHRYRPDLSLTIVRAAPTGLAIVTGFGGASPIPPAPAEIVSSIERLEFEDWTNFQSDFASYIPNRREAVLEHLAARVYVPSGTEWQSAAGG